MSKSGGYVDYAFVAELYDHVVPYRARSDVSFYVDAAREARGPVLELGCGTGRILLPIARAGIDAVGVDLSSHMLAACRHRLQQEPEDVQARVQILEADMRDFELGRAFNLVTTPFRSFQHITTVEDQNSSLESIHRHLVDGGRLILDIFNPSLEALTRDNLGEEFGEEPEFTMPDGRRIVRRHKNVARDLSNQIIDVEIIYYVTYPDGREDRLVHSFPMRYLFRYEAQHLLERYGFGVEHVYSDFDRKPYGSKYPGELIFIARKLDT